MFPAACLPGQHLSTRQYSRLVKWWVDLIGLEPSGRWDPQPAQDQGQLALQEDRQPSEPVSSCLDNTKLESTVRYLGVELDDALLMTEALEG